MNLQATPRCHSERSEESRVHLRASRSNRNIQRCFSSLNMTATSMRLILRFHRSANARRLHFSIGALLLVVVSSAASAKESYKFEPSGSKIGFSVRQFLGTTQGKFTNFSGSIEVDREHPENSSVTAQIEARSIDTQIKKRDDHLRSAEFFDVQKFPRITFKSRSVKRTGPQSGDILGDLTMHDVTKPVTLNVVVNKVGQNPLDRIDSAGFSARGTLKRSDFGMTTYLGAIGDDVDLIIEIEAKKKY